jgi:hypothetical protein
MSSLHQLRDGIERIKSAERGEGNVERRDFRDLMDDATGPGGVDTLAIEGKRVGRSNGGIPCDVTSGPCSCGAWH